MGPLCSLVSWEAGERQEGALDSESFHRLPYSFYFPGYGLQNMVSFHTNFPGFDPVPLPSTIPVRSSLLMFLLFLKPYLTI